LSDLDDKTRRTLTLVAKNRVTKWYDEQADPTTDRRALLSGVETLLAEIGTRDDQIECRTVLLGDGAAPAFHASSRRSRIVACGRGLAVAAIGPDWGYGWRRLIADDHAEYVLSWFAHYARQYVHRSEFARALMIAWERDRAILHMFGSAGMSRRYNSEYMPNGTMRTALATACTEAAKEWGAVTAMASRSPWLRRNTLDPAIHQGIFHFLRGQRLAAAEFEVEALVAFDCVIAALQTMSWPSASKKGAATRAELFAELGLGPRSIADAQQINFMRNHFGAHPGGWRWWDSGDEYDEDFITKAGALVWRMLRRAADLEPQIRTFDPHPPSWSDWLLRHFPRIWALVWFQ
jgi:hypothetical protein